MSTRSQYGASPAELLELADRCEREEASRELNAEIFCATAPSPFSFYGDCVLAQVGGFAARVELSDIPPYTTSLDAAVGLVPEGWFWLRKSEHTMTCCLPGAGDKDWGTHIDANAHTPALALCAAALRARAALAEDETGSGR